MTYLHLLEPVISYGSKIYMIASELISITFILWCINLVATITEKLYLFGRAFGTFYRANMHGFIKDLIVHLITLTVYVGGLTIQGTRYVYNNRREIAQGLNTFRNRVGSYFVLKEYPYVRSTYIV